MASSKRRSSHPPRARSTSKAQEGRIQLRNLLSLASLPSIEGASPRSGRAPRLSPQIGEHSHDPAVQLRLVTKMELGEGRSVVEVLDTWHVAP